MSFIYLFCIIFLPPTSTHKHTHNHDNIADDVTEQQQYNSECSGHVQGSAQQQQKQIGGNPAKSFVAASCSTDTSRPVELSVMVLYVG